MRPYVVGGACHRVQRQIDAALAEGVLELPPELQAHAERCPQCAPQVRETEALFRRLRAVPASLDLGRVPSVVDGVLRSMATGESAPVAQGSPATAPVALKRRSHLRWVLGQVAAMAAVLVLAVSGLTFLVLQVNHAAGGAKPAEVVQRWVAPLQNWSRAMFPNTR